MMLIKSRYLMLGIVALVFGSSVLAFNFTNEYLALNRETPLTKLPSFQSMLNRTGIRAYDKSDWLIHRRLDLKYLLEMQLYRIGGMSIPYDLPGYENKIHSIPYTGFNTRVVIWGGIVFIASLAGLFFTRHKMLMATMALFGIAWGAIMIRQIDYHVYESLFLIGVPLTLFTTYIDRLFSRQLIVGIAIVALIVFALSAQQISRAGHDEERIRYEGQLFEDFEAMRQIAKDKIISFTFMIRLNMLGNSQGHRVMHTASFLQATAYYFHISSIYAISPTSS